MLVLFFALAQAAAPISVSGGLRATASLFDEGDLTEPPGSGSGGQLRVRAGRRVGTEWFYDYLTNQVDMGVRRMDQHIGWSIMLYPTPVSYRLVEPYLVAGHCFDYTRMTIDQQEERTSADRWSSAVQAGAGVHLNLAERFDLSGATQYMIHLGRDLHYDGHGLQHEARGTFEGHLLMNLSVNYRFTAF